MANLYQYQVPTPFTPGSEYAGVISVLGPGVEGLSVGQRVMGSAMVGAFAEQVVSSAAAITPLADSVDLRAPLRPSRSPTGPLSTAAQLRQGPRG